jgi:hypothetical protein
VTATALPPRWSALRHVEAQARLCLSKARFDVVEAGRRSGKTELVKRLGVIEAVAMGPEWAARGLVWTAKYCAPTLRQAKDIYWRDLQDLSRPWWAKAPNITDKVIFLRGGGEIWVCGLDKPQRVEGSPADRLSVDELADVKAGAWDRHLYPALGTAGRPGRAWLIGVPRPGSQFADLAKKAKNPAETDYAYHTWSSKEVVDEKTWREAQRGTDPFIFAQEWEGKRVGAEGRAYHAFTHENLRETVYQPKLPLLFCFDFGTKPGVAVVVQEQALPNLTVAECPLCSEWDPGLSGQACKRCRNLLPLASCTVVVGEVHIPIESNTSMVATRLIRDWGHHQGPVLCYGDPAGGARVSSAKDGTDWDTIRDYFRRPFPQAVYDVDRVHPPQRARVNSVNRRCCNAAGERRLLVDPTKAPNTQRDLDGQPVVKGGSGELDKTSDPSIGHASDGLGYCVHKLHPTTLHDPMLIEAYA